MSEKMTAEEALERLAAYHVPSESGQDLLSTIHAELEALRKDAEKRMEIITAVAHIGIDFGFGVYEMEQQHIDSAREIYEAAALEADNG